MPWRDEVISNPSMNKNLDVSDLCFQWYLSNYSSISAVNCTKIMEEKEFISKIWPSLMRILLPEMPANNPRNVQKLKQIQDIGITGSFSNISASIQEPLAISPKGQPVDSSDRGNAVWAARRIGLAPESSSQKRLMSMK